MNTDTKLSKRLSFWLRHKPEDAGLTLTNGGWVEVQDLLHAFNRQNIDCSRAFLERVVASNDKKRFEFSEDGQMIRARQGHSIEVDLGLEGQAPPEFLFHGTATRFLPAILKDGLKPMSRHHVHLSQNRNTAIAVGTRYGKPAALTVAAGNMHAAGHVFFRTGNGVWLTDAVPPDFLTWKAE
ncbi:RNA 2'-phosphotransferase [Roseibium sp.]|uniref:RNA 2'-phosphotransferase n=1 Tax=Roseibium sp. TaxID=1936156 RepID=UPI003D0DED71